MYIHYDYDKPSITQHHWFNESEETQKIINISNKDPQFTNWYYIGIHSYGDDECQYEFIVDQDMTENNDNDDVNKSIGNMLGGSGSDETCQIIPPNMQKCENCGKLISKQSFMMHSMRCANVNWKCIICDKVIAKSMKSKHIHCKYWKEYNCPLVFESESGMQRHIDLRHTEIECNLCGCKLFPNQLQSHQENECPFRKVKCQYCGMKLKYLEIESHEKYCGSLTVECELCGETVTRKWLQNHLASEHNINPTLQTSLIDTIIHSNLGLDQSMNWEKKENEIGPDGQTIGDMIRGLDDDDDYNMNNQDNKPLNELEDLDPMVADIKRQLSRTASIGDVASPSTMQRTVTDPSEHDKIEESEEEEYDGDVHEFACPFCQKHPPKSVEFGEHLAQCSEQQMNDSD